MGYVLQIKMWVVVKYSKYGRWGSSTSPLNNESTDMRGERRKQRSKLKNCRLEWGGDWGYLYGPIPLLLVLCIQYNT